MHWYEVHVWFVVSPPQCESLKQYAQLLYIVQSLPTLQSSSHEIWRVNHQLMSYICTTLPYGIEAFPRGKPTKLIWETFALRGTCDTIVSIFPRVACLRCVAVIGLLAMRRNCDWIWKTRRKDTPPGFSDARLRPAAVIIGFARKAITI